MHPNSAIIAMAASRRSRRTHEGDITRDEVGWTPGCGPASSSVSKWSGLWRENPKLKGVILGHHGLINWADDDKRML